MALKFDRNNFVVQCMIVSVCFLTTCSGAHLRINEKEGLSLATSTAKTNNRMAHSHRQTVRQFAKRSLCKDDEGKIEFYTALSDHLCEISEELRVAFVKYLCKHKDKMLGQWVADVYDKDRDGYISHYERSYYND